MKQSPFLTTAPRNRQGFRTAVKKVQGKSQRETWRQAMAEEEAIIAAEEAKLKRASAGYITYGEEVNVEISLGEGCLYTVIGDGKGGCKLRSEPEYTSAAAGEADLGAVVTVDRVLQLPGGAE